VAHEHVDARVLTARPLRGGELHNCTVLGFRHEDEKMRSAISMRNLQTPR
jgi:hypothetical protein